MGYTGITILGAYGVVTSVIIIILGVIITYDNCGEMVDVDDCKEITMGDGGKVTEIHNRLIKVDLLNSDQAEMGQVDSNGKSECGWNNCKQWTICSICGQDSEKEITESNWSQNKEE